jgi:hypothetical protein
MYPGKPMFSRLNLLKSKLRKLLTFLVSNRLPPSLRQIALIDGLISMDEAIFLYELAAKVEEGCIVEVGSYRGRSTAALAQGSMSSSNSPVFAIEPHEPFQGYYGGNFGPEDRAAFFRAMLSTQSYKVVRLLNTVSETASAAWTQPVGLLFIDGDHSYEGVKADFDSWARHMLPNATVVFDDSIDKDCGPNRLISELIQTKRLVQLKVVGKLTQLGLPKADRHPLEQETATTNAPYADT